MHNLPDFINTLAPYIHSHGYLGVGLLVLVEDFGVPVPGETILITASVFAGLNQLNIFAVIIIAILAAVIGDNIGYSIGRYGGHALIERFGKYVLMTPKRINKAETAFRQKGSWLVIVARFVEGLRQLNGILAGLAEMSWPKFVSFNTFGAVLWVGTWTYVGYYGGSHIKTILHYQVIASLILIAGIIIYILAKLLTRHKKL